MKKLIDVPDEILRNLKHMAIDNDMSVKAYIEYIVFTHAGGGSKKENLNKTKSQKAKK
jgi:hypothetical protein